MGKIKRRAGLRAEEAVEFLNHLWVEKPMLPLLISLILGCWVIEKWIFSLTNWVPLLVAVWATIQYQSFQRQILVADLNKKWERVILNTSPITPLEHCQWLNKLLMEVWQNYMNPKFSLRLSSTVEKRLKHRKPRLIEKLELQEFSLGSSPPSLGLQGARWSASNDQKLLRLGFDWDTSDMSILLLAKLARPLIGTARIVINSLHIKGDLLLVPILDGKSILYSFVSTPEVRIGVAFGGGGQSLPATELPGVSSWLVRLFTDTLVKTMVEPRRRCFSLPAEDLRKKALGGTMYVTVISGSNLSKSSLRGSPSRKYSLSMNGSLEERNSDKDLQTFVEVELEELTRRTNARKGVNPKWDSTFNMILHDDTGTVRFNLYECNPGSVKYDFLASCEIKVKYVADGSTTFWAIASDSGVIAKNAEFCGKEIEMVVPFEGVREGELTVRLALKEWQFADGSHSLAKFHNASSRSLYGSSNFISRTGRVIRLTVVEGKELLVKDKSGKSGTYIKLQYAKAFFRTKTVHTPNPNWNQKFEFDEIGGGEYLKIKCYSEDKFGDENIGSARINLEGLVEGSIRDVWIPLENVNSGDLRLQIEVVRVDDNEGSMGSATGSGNGWIELVLVEARDLVAADRSGTSDPYVKVQYGKTKRRTKVMYKTLNPEWNQTLEFPYDGSPLVLHVKDYNSVLPTSSIGDCTVEYKRLPPNQMADKWIPLQGVKRGEIRVQITRKVPGLQNTTSSNSVSFLTKAHQISSQMKQMMVKFQSLIDEGNLEELSTGITELETLQDTQEEYMVQLETEEALLLNKIRELGREMFGSSPSSLSGGSSRA